MAERHLGICAYCGATVYKSSIGKHLETCAGRREAERLATRRSEAVLFLRAEYVRDQRFFLDLEACGSATLTELDQFLRTIWLECCGHRSEFTRAPGDGKPLGKSRTMTDVFALAPTLHYVFDFGTPTALQVRVLGVRESMIPTSYRSLALMVRNRRPAAPCVECGEPGSLFCEVCLDESDRWSPLCAACTDRHRHRDADSHRRLYNSPRVGFCGYDGPAEAPR